MICERICDDSIETSRDRVSAALHEVCDIIVCLPVDDKFDVAVAALEAAGDELQRAYRFLTTPTLTVVRDGS
jgi:hypothetical protein